MSRSRGDEAIEVALELLEELGLEGEAYVEDRRQVRVTVSGEAVESISERRDLGLAVRVFTAGAVGFSFSSDLTAEAIRRCLLDAREIARHMTPDDVWRLAEPAVADPLPFPNEDPASASTTTDERIELALSIERAARATDPRVRRTREAACQDSRGRVWIASTAGVSAAYSWGRATGSVEVTATEGERSEVGYFADFALGPASLDPEEIGRTGAAKALAKLGAESARTGVVAAVLDREVVAGLLDAWAPALSGRRVLKGTSPLAGRLGERIASPVVRLVDDPRLPGGFGSAPVDGEGVPTRRVALIEEGWLRAFLHDTFSARKTGQAAPGNAVRDSYRTAPQIGPANLLLLPGEDPPEALLERAGTGVLIAEVMGLHTVNVVTGDFSLGGSGRWIERGQPSRPVHGLAFSGNVLELLASVEAVGSDLKLFPGEGGAPSVLLRELSVAGS